MCNICTMNKTPTYTINSLNTQILGFKDLEFLSEIIQTYEVMYLVTHDILIICLNVNFILYDITIVSNY